MKVAKRANLQSSDHKQRNSVTWCDMSVNYIYCGDHFAIYTNIEALCCIPEANVLC